MITTFNVATLLSDTDMHSTGFPQFPMNVHEGLKDGPQPAFNLSILIQWYQLMHNWLLACCPSLFHKSKSVKITWGYFSDYGIYT